MEQRILEKLEFPALLDILAAYSQTDDGRALCLDLAPTLPRSEIEQRWADAASLKNVVNLGFKPPIGAIIPMLPIFKAASLGQILGGTDFRAVFDLLSSTKRVFSFAADHATKCATLRRVRVHIYPLPNLMTAIEKTVAPHGELLDTASEELQSIRRQKLSLTRKIEEQIKKLLREAEVEQYLQDDFYTMRADRYVIPMRLDGRGRIKGSIIDTSDSGQTLFIEPAVITPLNEQLVELDLAEKIEILRIFRELTGQVASELETLRINYDQIIALDFLTAQAGLAVQLDAGPAQLVDTPSLDLRSARHPLIRKGAEGETNPTRFQNSAVASDILLDAQQSCLIVSGPNAGGKTVILKTVGLVHVMAKAGLLIPVDATSRLFLYERIYLEMGDAQNLAASLSTFSGHILGLKPILDRAGPHDLALLDELAVGTEPQTGSAIGQAILESLASRKTHTVATTHFDNLKGLPVSDPRFRNGSMEYSLKNMQPTYQLILDVPGQSHGIEVARQMGLPATIIERAKELRGENLSSLDAAVTQLMEARDETRRLQDAVRTAQRDAEAEKARWEQERELLAETRKKAGKQVAERYESELAELKNEFEDVSKLMRQAYKEVQKGGPESDAARQSFLNDKQRAGKAIKDLEGKLGELTADLSPAEKLPGEACAFEDLRSGTDVYVIPVKKKGSVVKLGDDASDPIEVQVGTLKLRVPLHDLRLMNRPLIAGLSRGTSAHKTASKPDNATSTTPGLVLQTLTNTVDLRGLDADQGLDAAMAFIDKALLRGEDAVVLIHGHGTDKLKTTLRRALKDNCPYDVRFRPGEPGEGGDGVTIVALRN